MRATILVTLILAPTLALAACASTGTSGAGDTAGAARQPAGDSSSWTALQDLEPGDRLTVISEAAGHADGRVRLVGRLVAVDDRGLALRADGSETRFLRPHVILVSRPSIWRWAGPLRDCAVIGGLATGIGALIGWPLGSASKGALWGLGSGCVVGVAFWYGDRSDTGSLEWETVYRRRLP